MSTRTHTERQVSDVTVARSYEQWCPIAVGLDVLGDRWTLLILRELLLDDQRFTDLRRALPGLAPNLLSERLRSLAEMGLVTTVELAPPAARSVYRLTDEGRATAPVLRALARFGARHLAGSPGPAMDARRAASALLVPWYRPADRPAGAPPLRARLVVTSGAREDASAVDLVLTRPIELERVDPTGDATDVDVVLTTTVEELAAARRAGHPLDTEPKGASRAVARFRDAFSI